MAPFKAHIPLCPDGNKTLTVELSVEQPPTSVRVPLDPTDATKFHDLPVDPSIWKKLNAQFLKLWDATRSTERDEVELVAHREFAAKIEDKSKLMTRALKLHSGQLEVSWISKDEKRMAQLNSMTGLLFEPIDGWAKYTNPEDRNETAMTERLNRVSKHQFSNVGDFAYKSPEHLLATNYAVLAECASLARTFTDTILCGEGVERATAFAKLDPNQLERFIADNPTGVSASQARPVPETGNDSDNSLREDSEEELDLDQFDSGSVSPAVEDDEVGSEPADSD